MRLFHEFPDFSNYFPQVAYFIGRYVDDMILTNPEFETIPYCEAVVERMPFFCRVRSCEMKTPPKRAV